jgi:hypothetical protein
MSQRQQPGKGATERRATNLIAAGNLFDGLGARIGCLDWETLCRTSIGPCFWPPWYCQFHRRATPKEVHTGGFIQ